MGRKQSLDFGTIKLDAVDDDKELHYFISGKRMYSVGAQSGEYPPMGWRRPGFLIGKRIADVGASERRQQAAHLLNEMGGIWAHPIKVLDGLTFTIAEEGEGWSLTDSQKFINHLAYVEFVFERNGLEVVRTDFVAEEAPALFATLRIKNHRPHSARFKLIMNAAVNIMPSWFSGLPNGEDVAFYDNGKGIAYDKVRDQNWGVVFGTNVRPEGEEVETVKGKQLVTFTYGLNLGAGEEVTMPFLVVAESQRGYPEAIRRFDILIEQSERIFQDKIDYYKEQIFSGVRFECSDPWPTMAFYNAKANLVMLTADVLPPSVGRRYLYAGIPEYVQFFGTDTAYSTPGLMVAGYWDLAKDALLGLAHFGELMCGRIPHEVTTSGRVFHPGNTQETPQFTIAAWNYFRWTGDRAFLEEVYPVCALGVLDYVPAVWDRDLDYYPDGAGVVERSGMGPEKLDVICYFTRAIYCLAEMAETLDKPIEAAKCRELADGLKIAINDDWWMEDEQLYTDSLEDDHSPHFDGHWTIAVPLETRLVEPPERALRSLERIHDGWVNEFGMVHTKDREDFVWTLPTGVLAMGEFAYGDPDIAARLLDGITMTLKTGALGTYKELIPEGLSFMQLWSPAMYLQGLIEGTFGLAPWATDDFIEISPRVPTAWSYAKVEDLPAGEHKISVRVDRIEGERTSVEHVAGRGSLKCCLKLPVKGRPRVQPAAQDVFKYRYEKANARDCVVVEFELEPFQCASATYRGNEIFLEIVSKAAPLLQYSPELHQS